MKKKAKPKSKPAIRKATGKLKKKPVKKAVKRVAKKPAKKAIKKPAKKSAKPMKKPIKKQPAKPAKPVAEPAKTERVIEPERRMENALEAKEGKREFEVKIQNIVAFTDLGTKVSLEKILQKVENTEYQPEQFPGLIYRMQSPRASALIFSQGKIVCTGTKSMPDLKEAMDAIIKNLRDVGFKLPTKYSTSVENIVASSAIKAELNLDEIAFKLENSEYEPEQFPGLVYRIKQPRVAFLLFKSGRIIITGGRTTNEIHEALGIFKKNLENIGIKVAPVKLNK